MASANLLVSTSQTPDSPTTLVTATKAMSSSSNVVSMSTVSRRVGAGSEGHTAETVFHPDFILRIHQKELQTYFPDVFRG
jgi:hypothetical protein